MQTQLVELPVEADPAVDRGDRAGGDIVAGKRAVTADTDLRLCRYFGMSDGWWLRGQTLYDTAMAKEAMKEELARIPRCSLLAA